MLSVLDLGCGTGLGYRLLGGESSGIQYTGRDSSTAMLGLLSARHPEVRTSNGSMDDLGDLGEASFDFVMAIFAAASYARSPQQLLSEVSRVLSPGGVCYLSFLNRSSLRRVVRLRRGSTEVFRTRGDSRATNAPTVFTATGSELRRFAAAAGLRPEAVHGYGPLGGVLELDTLWTMNSVVARRTSVLSHLIDLVCASDVS
jgi:SAM-dependent methyltransferase